MHHRVLLRGTVTFLWVGTLVHVIGGTPVLVRADSTRGARQTAAPALNVKPRDALPRQLALPQENPAPLEGLESLKRVTHRARPGDSIGRLLIRFGVPEGERNLWIRSIEKHYPGKKLPVGKDWHFYFSRSKPTLRDKNGRDSLRALEIELDEDWVLTWEKGTKGIVFTKRERPYEIERKTAGGIIDTTLFVDGARAGLDESLLSQLVDIFSWDVDFEKDIQRGDTFRVVYEERARKGSARKPLLRILAAELVSAGQQYVAIYFENGKGKAGYYDLDGRSLARAFLRFPLEFTRISSFFTHSRLNPVLKIDRPHHGVDFVAGRGTAVRAIGDGKVRFSGWRKGGYGRMIELQHGFEYATRYAHLQGFAKGIRSGISVKKGQVIGYVGSSGLTTGSHLHFELYREQQYVDPLKFEFPHEDRIEPGLRRAFEDLKQTLLAQLAATPHS